MTDAFVWWLKRTISTAIVKSQYPDHFGDVFEASQSQWDESFRKIQKEVRMDNGQVQALQDYIYRSIERREKLTAGTPNDIEAIRAQEKDDADLKAALAADWMDLI